MVIKTVHLGKQLVQGLLALVVSRKAAAIAFLTDGVDLIDEDDTRGFLFSLFE